MKLKYLILAGVIALITGAMLVFMQNNSQVKKLPCSSEIDSRCENYQQPVCKADL